MSFSKSNLNSAFLLSSKPTFNSQEPQINLQNLSLNGIMPEILPFLLSNNSQLLLKNSSLSQFSKPSSYSPPTLCSNKKVKTEDGLSSKPFDMLQKLSGINPNLASSLLSETQSQFKTPILSAFHSSQSSGPVPSHQMNFGSDLMRKLSEDNNINNSNILSGLLKQLQSHSSPSETSTHITDTVTQIKLHNLIPMAQPGLLEVQQSEIIFNPILTNSINDNIQQKLQSNLNLLNYQRQTLQIPLLISQNLAFNHSDGSLSTLLNFQNNSNPVGSQLLNFSNPNVCECSHTSKKESAKNPCSSDIPTPSVKKSKTYKKFVRKQQERSEEQTATSLETEMTENSPKMAERKLNKLQQMRKQKEEEQTKRREEMMKNGEVEQAEPELTREQVGEEAIQEFLNNVEGVYSNTLTELNKERALRLLSKFNWNIPKVLDSIKKNKSYYKKYLDGLTGN